MPGGLTASDGLEIENVEPVGTELKAFQRPPGVPVVKKEPHANCISVAMA